MHLPAAHLRLLHLLQSNAATLFEIIQMMRYPPCPDARTSALKTHADIASGQFSRITRLAVLFRASFAAAHMLQCNRSDRARRNPLAAEE